MVITTWDDKEQFDSKTPEYNLNISLSLKTSCFIDCFYFKKMDFIEMYGNAISNARKHLEGQKHVTESNVIKSGKVEGIINKEADICIDNNYLAINTLGKLLSGELPEHDNWPKIKIIFDQNKERKIIYKNNKILLEDLC